MKFHKQDIDGVWLIETEPVVDNRGAFHRHFCVKEFAQTGIPLKIAQTNISANKKKHTLRGFHYQVAPHEEAKVLTCLRGSFCDVVVDLRPESKTFMQWKTFELNAVENFSLYVPAGCANGYLTLEDSTTILYYMSEFYSPESYTGFRYNDPAFNVEWPTEPVVISEKDKSFAYFDPISIKP